VFNWPSGRFAVWDFTLAAAQSAENGMSSNATDLANYAKSSSSSFIRLVVVYRRNVARKTRHVLLIAVYLYVHHYSA